MDEEDVVQIAFAQFFRQIQEGRSSKIDDRNTLWQILAMLVDRRAKDQDRQQKTEKGGKGQVRTESMFMKKSDGIGSAGLGESNCRQAKLADLIDYGTSCCPSALFSCSNLIGIARRFRHAVGTFSETFLASQSLG